MSVPKLQCPSNNKPNTDPLWGVVRFFSGDSDFHPEPGFDRMLYLERKRTERSRRPFMLLLLNVEDLMPGSDEDPFVRELETALSSCVRETDIKGWYEHGKVAGVILTELNSIDEVVKEKSFLKIQDLLVKALGSEAVQKIRVSYHVFPESSNGNGRDREWLNTRLYPEVTKKTPEAHERVREILSQRRKVLDDLAHLLLEKEVVQGEELREMLSKSKPGIAASSPEPAS